MSIAKKIKIICVAGARPNFMKIAPLMRELKKHENVEAFLVHTGQHYDKNMSESFFRDLDIPSPDVNLEVGSGSQAYQTAEIMRRFEPLIEKERPDLVIVVGDVNSTIACALTAVKLGIKVAHVEAGLRSFDRTMPEEINRVLTDVISDYLFITEPSAKKNLLREGIDNEKIYFVGNVMIDTLITFKDRSSRSDILKQLDLAPHSYALLTLHRPSNVDDVGNLTNIIEAIYEIQKKIKIVFPVHPRTKQRLNEFNLDSMLSKLENILCIEPVGYLDFMKLMMESGLVLTDSGGMQEETTILKIPCITLRNNTERPITEEMGTNIVVGTDKEKIVAFALRALKKDYSRSMAPELWDGKAAERIVRILADSFHCKDRDEYTGITVSSHKLDR